MPWIQRQIALAARSRGCHLVTRDVLQALPELTQIRTGLLHVFIQHTSASLTINENADADVRTDLESSLNALAPEDAPYVHTLEGPDDMPAHVKASLMGSSVSIPVASGKLLRSIAPKTLPAPSAGRKFNGRTLAPYKCQPFRAPWFVT